MPKDNRVKKEGYANIHSLSPEQIDRIREARWRCRTDLLYLARDILKKDRVSAEFNGPLIDRLQKFPKPTPEQAVLHDRWTSDGWQYKPLIPDLADLPGKRRQLFIDFRSSYKTTINCECHTIQWLLNYPDICIAIFQYKLEKAESILKAIKEHFLNNKKFRALFPELCPVENATKFGNAGQFSVANATKIRKSPRREDSVMAAALEAGLAGYHFEVMKFSDVVDTENSETEEQCLKTITKFGQAKYLLVDPALNWITVEGTRYHFKDLYGKIIEDQVEEVRDFGGDLTKSAWDIYCRGIFKVRHNDADMKFIPEELKMIPILDENGKRIPWDVPTEPKRFPLEGLEREERIDPANFSAQMRNVPFSGRQGITDFEVVVDPITSEKSIPKRNVVPLSEFDRFPTAYTVVSVDPAETTTERSNYTAIVVAKFDRHGRVYIVDIIHGKWNPTDVAKKILETTQKYCPEYLCLEEVSATRNLLPYIEREWALFPHRYWRPTVKMNKRDTKVKKEEKIRLCLHSPYETGDLRFVRELIPPIAWHNLVLEFDQFPKGGQDDILDALAEIYASRTWFGQEYARPQVDGGFIIKTQHPDITMQNLATAMEQLIDAGFAYDFKSNPAKDGAKPYIPSYGNLLNSALRTKRGF